MQCGATPRLGRRRADQRRPKPTCRSTMRPARPTSSTGAMRSLISGVTTTVKVAHVRLCHSCMMFARPYMRESQEMVFDAHDRAFAFFKGTCTRGIYDNMKTAVEAVFIGKERLYNRLLLQMCSHYLVQPVTCTPASGWEHWYPPSVPEAPRNAAPDGRLFQHLRKPPSPLPRDRKTYKSMCLIANCCILVRWDWGLGRP